MTTKRGIFRIVHFGRQANGWATAPSPQATLLAERVDSNFLSLLLLSLDPTLFWLFSLWFVKKLLFILYNF